MGDSNFLSELVKDSKGSLAVANEFYYGDVLAFLREPDTFLDGKWATGKLDDDYLYTDWIRSDGSITCSIRHIAYDLIKVNAYTEALAIFEGYLELIKKIYNEVSKEDKDNIKYVIDDMQREILETISKREEYTSNRKATMARFDDIIKVIHSRN